MNTSDTQISYKKKELPKTPKEWKEYKEEKARQKREWKEQKLLKRVRREQEEGEVKLKLQKLEQDTEEKLQQVRTVSIALPGSVLDNAQTPQLKALLASQIARAAAIYSISEIVVFDESNTLTRTPEGATIYSAESRCCELLITILQYLETPQYLRKRLYPQQKMLQHVGLLPPLNCPHHLSASDQSEFREGVVMDKLAKGDTSFVDIGLDKQEVRVDKKLAPFTRCTVRLQSLKPTGKKFHGCVVSPQLPTAMTGVYWGYSVRLARGLSEVLGGAPYSENYDLLLGTSDRGEPLEACAERLTQDFRHALIVFGGVQGLEYSLDNDPDLRADDPATLFDVYLNSCPGQGSRTIRTEEAVLLTLSALRPVLRLNQLTTGSS